MICVSMILVDWLSDFYKSSALSTILPTMGTEPRTREQAKDGFRLYGRGGRKFSLRAGHDAFYGCGDWQAGGFLYI